MPSTNAGDDGSDQQLLSRSALPVGSSSRHRVWQSRSGIEGVTVVAIVSVVDIALDVDRDDHFVVAAPTVAPQCPHAHAHTHTHTNPSNRSFMA